jgi:hypothetical protein
MHETSKGEVSDMQIIISKHFDQPELLLAISSWKNTPAVL